jgi:hypothetical protein
MLTYDDLLETFSLIINNEGIKKDGLLLFYELEEENHKKLDEHLFYKTNDRHALFEHRDIIEIDIEGFTIRIIKKGWQINIEDLED